MIHRPAGPTAALHDLRRSLASGTRVDRTTLPTDDWHIQQGVLRHRRADFFEVVGLVDQQGDEHLLLRQPETALAGLVTTVRDGVRLYLLNARCEPGLHGFCQFSTTVQSTPSNYLRRHGGSATPFIDLFVGDAPARVLHDSLEYDWGQYYDGKRKRFMVVEIDAPVPASSPCVWVTEDELRALLAEDHSVTSDLRAACALIWAADLAPGQPRSGSATVEPASDLVERPLESLGNWIVDERGIREVGPRQGVSIEYVDVTSGSREVRRWAQPLMTVDHPLRITLVTRTGPRGVEAAVHRRTQVGLGRVDLLFPAVVTGGSVQQTRRTSAEGGRFLLHEVVLELVRHDDAELVDGAEWMTIGQLAEQVATPSTTSVDLRLVLTLLPLAG